MKKTFFTVGPTQTHPRLGEFVAEALKQDICSISHRGKAFEEIFSHAVSSLKRLLDVPDGSHVFFLGSATEAMERFVENCVGSKSFHFVNGAFSKRFFSIAAELKKDPQKLEAPTGEGFDLGSADIPKDAEVVCFTHNETATGVETVMEEIHALKKKNPDKLFAVDIVSSAPSVGADLSLIDCAFFSVQKGFGMPSGLGVLIVNDRCLKKAEELQKKSLNIGSFHNFPTLLKFAQKNQTPETPNTLGIYLLGRISDAYNAYGIERIRKETDEKAALIYEFFDAHPEYKPFVKNIAARSKTTITIETPHGSADVVQKFAERGFVVAKGYGESKEKQIRIGNFPAHTIEDVRKLLKVLA